MSEPAERREASRSGTERAAILLLTLGENEAAQVLKHMGAKEVQRIGTAMAKLANVSREEVHGVICDFAQTVESQTSVGVGADEFLRRVLVMPSARTRPRASSTGSTSAARPRASRR